MDRTQENSMSDRVCDMPVPRTGQSARPTFGEALPERMGDGASPPAEAR